MKHLNPASFILGPGETVESPNLNFDSKSFDGEYTSPPAAFLGIKASEDFESSMPILILSLNC